MHERERAEAINAEKAILVRVILPDQPVDQGDPLDELLGLAETAGSVVVAGMVQRRDKPTPNNYLGAGKVDELVELVTHHEAEVVIFDNDLSPGQTRNLEKATGAKVIDRTELILDIFATHAQTYESRLAVELAQLEYSLPRLKRMWTHLSRMKMGVGMRGPGEKQLETDRRLVEKRISDLKKELGQVERRKERQVAGRRGFMTVSLVGYTNAGKSTLMNRLTEAGVKAQDQLFATLDTRTRRWQLPAWGPVLLSDTVGFIRDLPHRLVASFKATLEETRQADLLLHVADASSPEVLNQISAVFEVLEGLGIEEKDTLLALNKVDQLDSATSLERILKRYPRAIAISAKSGEGIEKLTKAVSEALSDTFREVLVKTSVSNGKLMAYIAAHGEIITQEYEEQQVTIRCRMPQKYLGRIGGHETTVEDLTPVAAVPESDSGDSTVTQKADSIFDDYDPAELRERTIDDSDGPSDDTGAGDSSVEDVA